MSTMPTYDDSDFDLFSANFLALTDLIARFGPEGLLNTTSEWIEVPLGEGLAIRSLLRADGSVWLQTTLNDVLRVQVRGDVMNNLDWQTVEARFDEEGDLTTVSIIKDNGLLRDDFYDDGIRLATRHTDVNGDYGWTDVTNYYNA